MTGCPSRARQEHGPTTLTCRTMQLGTCSRRSHGWSCRCYVIGSICKRPTVCLGQSLPPSRAAPSTKLNRIAPRPGRPPITVNRNPFRFRPRPTVQLGIGKEAGPLLHLWHHGLVWTHEIGCCESSARMLEKVVLDKRG